MVTACYHPDLLCMVTEEHVLARQRAPMFGSKTEHNCHTMMRSLTLSYNGHKLQEAEEEGLVSPQQARGYQW